jgi:hypothetical protein
VDIEKEIASVADKLKTSTLVRGIDRVRKGHFRVCTGFYYPDGSSIDVFIPVPNLAQTTLLLEPPRLTDFGGTIAWLDNLLIQPYRQPRRKEILQRIMDLHGCVYQNGVIEYPLQGWEQRDFERGIINLGQACARLSDLVFNARYRGMDDFDAEVQDRLSVTEYVFEQDAEIPYKSGTKSIRLNFLVKGRQRDTGILTLSSADPRQAQNRANAIYVLWDDLELQTNWRGNKVTLYNDAYPYDADLLGHLERKSSLISGNDNESLWAILDAA